MSADVLRLIVFVVELVAKLLPGAISVGQRLFDAIDSHGDLSDDEKAALKARVKATGAAVAAYEPRPHPGSPTLDVPEPKPTAPG